VAHRQLATKVLAVLSQVRKLDHVSHALINQHLVLICKLTETEQGGREAQELQTVQLGHIRDRAQPQRGTATRPPRDVATARPTNSARGNRDTIERVTLAVTVRPNGAEGALLAGSSNTTALHSRLYKEFVLDLSSIQTRFWWGITRIFFIIINTMNIIYILLFCTLVLSTYILVLIIYRSKNTVKHRESESLYAHFSIIDQYNYILFPSLLFTHPIHLTLNKGECLYIPRNWWHWVKTEEKTFAINYWFTHSDEIIKPFVFKSTSTVDFDTLLGNERVHIWDKDKSSKTFREFYTSGLDDSYLITLQNYGVGDVNTKIKNLLRDHIEFPKVENVKEPSTFDYNVWVTSGKHDTGLHYDDEDGILHVIEGRKKITLFPPSDTPYLGAFKTEYPWLKKEAKDFHYNRYLFIGYIPGVSSSQFLYETCKHNKKVLANISKFYKMYKESIWAFKKQGDKYRWEMYSYDLKRDPIIISRDIFPDSYEFGKQEHMYHNLDDKIGLPFWGNGTYKEDGLVHEESNIFVLDTTSSFKSNYDKYMTRLGYEKIMKDFHDIVFKYKCYETCIHNKHAEQIFIQYLGISKNDFITFLTDGEYPQHIVDFVKDEEYQINNEITIVYDIKSHDIIRSGFYGLT